LHNIPTIFELSLYNNMSDFEEVTLIFTPINDEKYPTSVKFHYEIRKGMILIQKLHNCSVASTLRNA